MAACKTNDLPIVLLLFDYLRFNVTFFFLFPNLTKTLYCIQSLCTSRFLFALIVFQIIIIKKRVGIFISCFQYLKSVEECYSSTLQNASLYLSDIFLFTKQSMLGMECHIIDVIFNIYQTTILGQGDVSKGWSTRFARGSLRSFPDIIWSLSTDGSAHLKKKKYIYHTLSLLIAF